MKKVKFHQAMGTPSAGYAAGKFYDLDDAFAAEVCRAGIAEEVKEEVKHEANPPKRETGDKLPSPVKVSKVSPKPA